MKLFPSLLLLLIVNYSFAQQPEKDKAVFKTYNPGFFENTILKDNRNAENLNKPEPSYTYFQVDFSGKIFPNDKKLYSEIWHNSPVCQGNSGTCWCYSATSFMESEARRISGVEVKLSEMFTVYWEYVDRALDFVKTRGKTTFSEGSEAASIPRVWKKYGIVPYSAYEGKPKERKYNSHRKMEQQMDDYLNDVKNNSRWNEKTVEKDIRAILDKEMGSPPGKFTFNNVEYTPQSFLSDYLKLKMIDYFSFMSTSSEKFNEKHELVEDDNWWHCSDYYNVTSDDFMTIVINSLKKGFSVCICGDISEPGYNNESQVAIIPDFDIPAKEIDDNARQIRLSNGSTTDDHCIHMVGYYEKDGEYWFLIKDSNGGAFDGKFPGYRFYREDFVKLKMMNILIYKEGGREVLDKIIK